MLTYVLVRIIEDRLNAVKPALSAKDVLHTLEGIQQVAIDLRNLNIERVTKPTSEQARILAALNAEATLNRGNTKNTVRHRQESRIKLSEKDET